MSRLRLLAASLALAACSDRLAREPTPPRYRWPQQFAWKVDYVSEAQRNRVSLLRYSERKTLRLALRDGDEYLLLPDSVLKTNQEPGAAPVLAPYSVEDTLAAYVRIGPRGEIRGVLFGCDPADPACSAALPSSVRLELRRIIPRLTVWPVPPRGTWADTLEFDDSSRPGGTRGRVITSYAAVGDTVVGAEEYWLVSWVAVRRTWPRAPIGGGIVETPPVEERGVTFVEKRRLLPVYSTWAGAAAAPPAIRALGATASGFRGRAYLAGSSFDSAIARESGREAP
ncbi:MAG TPA: hypothetical protein VNL98_04360 [Gemmatimonadales bacterium]|nr:hypothetical protein [Gemmatimonadales bacterium]